MKNLYKGLGFLVLSTILLTPFSAFAATNEGVATASNVLVVYNSAYITDSNSDSVQDSLELANYYKAKRNIPDANVVGIDTPTTLAITRSDYNTYIKSPLETYLTDNNLKDSIQYIVFVKGIPMKVYDTSGPANNYVNSAGNHSSVDSSTLFLFQTNYSSTDGKIINPYFNVDPSLQLDNRFKSNTFGSDVKIQYLVTRLDGYTVTDVKNMIDRASNTDKSGTGYFVLDKYSGANNFGFDSIANTATNLKNLGKNTYPDPFTKGNSAITSLSSKSVMGYTSYGIYAGLGNDFYNNDLDFTYLNGAVASTYESYTAFSNVEPDNTNFGQIYQFIRAGGSGGIGNVYEPFTNGLPNDSVYMPAYSVGYTWADAAYMSLPVISWQAIVVGDPLMRIVSDNISTPTVTTNTETNLGMTSVTLNGNITNTGGENNIVRGFKYGITNTYGSFVKEIGTFSTGGFSLDITGLTCNTTYYYQVYSANSFRSGFGSGSTFTTSACAVPIIITDSAYDTTISSTKLAGTITD
ncbi:MAG: TIGR03790 family protein, partial [Saprospiraceae bacterium]|nr:TIGR03790 family protein [Saprospiraceae bacterium]